MSLYAHRAIASVIFSPRTCFATSSVRRHNDRSLQLLGSVIILPCMKIIVKNICLYNKPEFIQTFNVLSKCVNANHFLHLKMSRPSKSQNLQKSQCINIAQNIISFALIFLPALHLYYYLT